MARYVSAEAKSPLRNRCGYVQQLPPGRWWTVLESNNGDPVRVHDGFAIFSSQREATQSAELMRAAHEAGRLAGIAAVRSVLGLEEEPLDG